MDELQVVFLIFSAGKLVCVGAKKEEQVYEAVDKIQKLLEELLPKKTNLYDQAELDHATRMSIINV